MKTEWFLSHLFHQNVINTDQLTDIEHIKYDKHKLRCVRTRDFFSRMSRTFELLLTCICVDIKFK